MPYCVKGFVILVPTRHKIQVKMSHLSLKILASTQITLANILAIWFYSIFIQFQMVLLMLSTQEVMHTLYVTQRDIVKQTS